MWAIILFSFFLLGALLILFFITSAFLGFVITRVPFVPTAARDIRTIAERVPLTPSDVIYDLGSGNGKVAFMLERLTGAQTVGFEATLWTHWYARLKRWLTRSKAKFIRGNFFKHNWSPATVIYCYLYPPLMTQIGEKILAECRPGTTVIVRDFPIANWQHTDYFRTYGRHEVFVYKV
jgi:hypothetical protein